MEYDAKDGDVIHLLKKLKEANGSYPPEMLALRRHGYLKQIAQVSGGAGLAVGLKNLVDSGGKGSAVPPATGTIVEILLVAALIAEAGAVAYFYRHKMVDIFRSDTNSPQVQEVSNPPVVPSLFVELEGTPTPSMTHTQFAKGTATHSSLGTPTLELGGDPTGQSQKGSPTDSNQNLSTPNGNNGNHYGQTPKPERTKEPGNDNSNNNQQDNNDPKKKN